MKKLLLLSLTLLFITLNSCKKEDYIDSIKNTNWLYKNNDNSIKYRLFFESKNTGMLEEYENGVGTDRVNFRYEYENSKGTMYFDDTYYETRFSVSGNKLTWNYDGHSYVFTKE